MTPHELRELFLFADLTAEQLDWVERHGSVVEFPADTVFAVEGEPARYLYLLLSGAITVFRTVRGETVELIRTDHKGSYTGATQFYFGDQIEQVNPGSSRTLTESTFLALPAAEFAEVFRAWFPMAVHLLQGTFLGSRNWFERVGERERLTALGELSAGLMHELNNPAAAASRATDTLRERLAGMRQKLAKLADGRIDGEQLRHLTELQESIVSRIAKAPRLTALEASDREDELGDWFDDHAVDGGWDLAPVFVAGGIGVADLDRVAEATADTFLEPAIRWLAYTVETETLLNDIIDATERVSTLVGAAKQYSQLDRAPHQWIDVHEGLDSTIVMLGHKIGPGIEVVKDYDRTLPQVPAYPAELNQVWTNLIDNALAAMGETGTLTVRTSTNGDRLLVEVCDTGAGVPEDLRQQVFQPFFTTKGVGEGTGLGLDVSRRIVVDRHGGDIWVESVPGDTRFRVNLPLRASAAPAT